MLAKAEQACSMCLVVVFALSCVAVTPMPGALEVGSPRSTADALNALQPPVPGAKAVEDRRDNTWHEEERCGDVDVEGVVGCMAYCATAKLL